MQADPPPPPAPGPVDVHINLDGLANLIWQSFIDHIGDVGNAVWSGVKDHIGDIGTTIWTPLANTLLGAVQAVWSATFGALANILGQLPPNGRTTRRRTARSPRIPFPLPSAAPRSPSFCSDCARCSGRWSAATM